MAARTILVIGTYDTKTDELAYLAACIHGLGGVTLTMDVSVLGESVIELDFSKHDVAQACGSSISAAIASGDENSAMQIMADGASVLVSTLYAQGRFDGVIVLGGSMGTDLALDVCAALPIGVPKYIVSTIAFSPLIPPQRLAADTQMILWAGGLYGLNNVCKQSLSQAAGAVYGAACAVESEASPRPMIGMTSLGKSALTYMVPLKPALEARGFDVAVFHATGMGGRAFENLAAKGAFACVFDFCTQELGNHVHGSAISAGPDRLTNAGLHGVPQIVAPGCHDLVDIAGWQGIPDKWVDSISHAHNRLITSIVLNAQERATVARAHADQLAKAKSASVFILPNRGCGEWDREGAELYAPDDLRAFCQEMKRLMPANTALVDLDAHINDTAFAEAALAVFDSWLEDGTVARPA